MKKPQIAAFFYVIPASERESPYYPLNSADSLVCNHDFFFAEERSDDFLECFLGHAEFATDSFRVGVVAVVQFIAKSFNNKRFLNY